MQADAHCPAAQGCAVVYVYEWNRYTASSFARDMRNVRIFCAHHSYTHTLSSGETPMLQMAAAASASLLTTPARLV